jgi:hypothetical protein
MNVNELIAILQVLPEEDRQRAIMLETEHDIFFNLQRVRYDNHRFLILTMYPDPFEEALRKAGVD